MWPVETLLWAVFNIGIFYLYCFRIAPALTGQQETSEMRYRYGWFIYSCGLGHLAMVFFMVLLHDIVWMFRVVLVVDLMTVIASWRVLGDDLD